MSKKQKDLIVYDNKLLECDSIFELRSDVSDDDWKQLITETIQFYCCLKVGQELSPTTIGNDDQRIIRRLKRSIVLFKRYDPQNMATIDIDEISKQHIESTKKGWAEYEQTMKIIYEKSNNNVNIKIS